MTLEEALKLARAFIHFLSLMGIAENHHRSRKGKNVAVVSKSCDDTFNHLIQGGLSPDVLYDTMCNQEVEIVLTAHPTQINRRTLQYKHLRIAHLLEVNDCEDLTQEDKDTLIEPKIFSCYTYEKQKGEGNVSVLDLFDQIHRKRSSSKEGSISGAGDYVTAKASRVLEVYRGLVIQKYGTDPADHPIIDTA